MGFDSGPVKSLWAEIAPQDDILTYEYFDPEGFRLNEDFKSSLVNKFGSLLTAWF